MAVRRSRLAVAAFTLVTISLLVGSSAASAATSSHSSQGARSLHKDDIASGNIHSTGDIGVCLDAYSGDYPNDGDPIEIWACNTHGEQQWTMRTNGQIVNTGTGECLDAYSEDYPNNGDPVQLWACNTHAEQIWKTIVIPDPQGPPAVQIVNVAHANLCITADGADYPSNGDPVELSTCSGSPLQNDVKQLWY
jgi:Ricin-type beta-trefoil lectin domain